MRGPSWAPGQRFERPRACRGDDTGAAAVEFALVILILIPLLIGIIEFSLLLRDHVSVASAVRTGARIASAEADAGPGICASGPAAPPCSPANVPMLAQNAADAIQKAGTAMPQNAIDEIWVYRSNPSGFPGSATEMKDAICATDCVVYRWVDGTQTVPGRFQYLRGSWQSVSIAACAGLNSDGTSKADAVGVIMKATHRFITGLFGATLSMSDRAVMQFEPLANDRCQANKPVGAGGHP